MGGYTESYDLFGMIRQALSMLFLFLLCYCYLFSHMIHMSGQSLPQIIKSLLIRLAFLPRPQMQEFFGNAADRGLAGGLARCYQLLVDGMVGGKVAI